MSNDLSATLSKPTQQKQTKYDLITTISNSMHTWYKDLLTTISWGWQKSNIKKDTKSRSIISNNQITLQGEKRWNKLITNRYPNQSS